MTTDLGIDLDSFLTAQVGEDAAIPEPQTRLSRQQSVGDTSTSHNGDSTESEHEEEEEEDDDDDDDEVQLVQTTAPIANVQSDIVRTDYGLRSKRRRTEDDSTPPRENEPASQLLSPVSPVTGASVVRPRSFASWGRL